jgi:hypothetical protein
MANSAGMPDRDVVGEPSSSLLARALNRLHPRDAQSCPALFLLETAAALLTVLAFRAVLLGAPAAPAELLCAAGLWAAVLAAACGLAGRR